MPSYAGNWGFAVTGDGFKKALSLLLCSFLAEAPARLGRADFTVALPGGKSLDLPGGSTLVKTVSSALPYVASAGACPLCAIAGSACRVANGAVLEGAFKELDLVMANPKMVKVLNGTLAVARSQGGGFNVGGDAFAGVGAGCSVDFAKVGGKLAIFETPRVTIATDVGVNISAAAFRTSGCRDPDHASGSSLSFGVGGSLTEAGLPVSAGGSVSLGISDAPALVSRLRAIYSDTAQLNALLSELGTLSANAATTLAPLAGQPALMLLAGIPGLGGALLAAKADASISTLKGLAARVGGNLKNNPDAVMPSLRDSLGALSGAIGPQYPKVREVLNALRDAASGCDGFGLNAGIGPSMAPVSGGVSYSYSQKITELDLPFDAISNVMAAQGSGGAAADCGPTFLRGMQAMIQLTKFLGSGLQVGCPFGAWEQFGHNGADILRAAR